MASLVGPKGAVYSFEPNPSLVTLLKESIERNGYGQVVIHPFALGEHEQELPLSFPADNQCLATLVREDCGNSIMVPVRTLSSCLDHPRAIRLMKIDVEGFEPQVLRGATGLFERVRPDAILFELNDYTGPFQEHPTVQFLKSFHYDFLMLPKRMLRMRAEFFPDKTLTGSPSNDLIAAPSGSKFNEIARLLGARRRQ